MYVRVETELPTVSQGVGKVLSALAYQETRSKTLLVGCQYVAASKQKRHSKGPINST